MKREHVSQIIFLIGLCSLGLVLRLDFLYASNFVIDADEAIVGLMAKHILEGADIPVFYYGQHYMGSFEALVSAMSFYFWGVSSAALKATPLLFSIALIPCIYLLTLSLGGRRAAQFAALFCAVPPSSLVIWSAKARGGFIELIFFGTVALLLTVRWLKSEHPSPLQTLWIGLTLGFGWWINNQIIYFMLPIGLMMLVHQVRDRLSSILQHVFVGVTSFLVGGLPFWIYNAERNFISFEMFGSAGGSDVWAHMQGLVTTALPIILGARRYWGTVDAFPAASVIVACIYGALFFSFVWWRRGEFVELIKGRVNRKSPMILLFFFVFAVCSVFALSSFGNLAMAPRYLLPLYTGIFVISGLVLAEVWRLRPRLAICYGVLILGLNVYSSYLGGRALPGEPFVYKGERVVRDQSPVTEWLIEHNIDMVRTNYWIGYRLAFESGEAVKFLVFQEPGQVRIPEYEERFEKGEERLRVPLVLVPGQAAKVRRALDVLGYDYQSNEIGGYVVISSIMPPHTNLELVDRSYGRVFASVRPEEGHMAFDGDVSTRWGSGQPQSPGMNVEIRLHAPTELRAIRYDYGQWYHDYPRGMQIDVEDEHGERRAIMTPEDHHAVRYFLAENTGSGMLYLDPAHVSRVIFTQTKAANVIFDWSFAEIILYK